MMTFGSAESATRDDYKSPAYYSVLVRHQVLFRI